jgi:hypothetical protein
VRSVVAPYFCVFLIYFDPNNNNQSLGALASIITASMADSKLLYGDNVGDIFPEVAEGRTAGKQACMQLAALVITICIAIGGGLLTGKVCRKKDLDPPKLLFNDATHFSVPDDGPLVGDMLDISIGELIQTAVHQHPTHPPSVAFS